MAAIPSLWLSPLGPLRGRHIPVEGPSDTRSKFFPSRSALAVKADPDFDTAPPCELGNVLRSVMWRTLYLRCTFDACTRIVLSKMDVKDTFGKVAVEWTRSPTCGQIVRDLVVVDRLPRFLVLVFSRNRARRRPLVISRRRCRSRVVVLTQTSKLRPPAQMSDTPRPAAGGLPDPTRSGWAGGSKHGPLVMRYHTTQTMLY